MKKYIFILLVAISTVSIAQNSIRLVDLNSNYLSIDNSNGAFFETGDFTFEMWIKIDAWDTGGYAGYKAGILSYNQSNFWLAIQSQGKPQLRMGCGDLTFSYTASDWVGNWKHIALVRVGETLNWYVDGQLSASKSCSGGKFMDTNTINIGTNPGWTCSIDGWISKIRYVKGTAVYTSDFTPVFEDLENISGTELLLNVANETDAFKDSSNANHTINLHGSNANPYFVANNGPLMPADILMSGDVSIENNQIKNVADPTDAQDVVTKNYLVASQSNTYSQQQVDQIISNLQEQINTLKAQSVNYGSNTFSSVIEVQNSLKPKEQIFTIFDNTVSNTIQGTNGTVIYINPNAITLNGSPYTGVVKATLDEYLTPNSMILSGIQTTSNGELLVTGGSFELDLEGEFGEDLDLANWSTSASMPLAVNLSNDFKSAMRFYVGERLQIDGREQVNWELNDFQEFGPPWQGFSEFYGINLGLSNCDVLYSSVIQGLGTQFSVLLEGVSDYNNAIVWMFINDFPSVVQITSLIENEQGFKTYADSIPVGLNATLLAIYVDEDDYLKFGTLEINVQGDDVFTIPLSFGTKDSLKALIESL